MRALIILRGRDLGLGDADLDELISRVMVKFFQRQKNFRYDPSKGRFRDYFRSIVTRTALDLIREKGHRAEVDLEEVPGVRLSQEDSREENYEKEWRAHIFSQALQDARVALPVRAVQAFIMNRLRNVPINDIAELQGVKKSTVYNDCNLVWDFLKVTVKHMVNEY